MSITEKPANQIVELLTRILCDAPTPSLPIDGAYVFCQTEDNQASVLQKAKSLIGNSIVLRVLMLKSDAASGYPGYAQFKKYCIQTGIPKGKIEGVPVKGTKYIHTRIESQALIRHARETGIGSLVIVSTPFHQLRAFMTAVTVALEDYPELLLYNSPGTALPWMETVTHSQGTLKAPRRQLIQEELIRIETYQKKGDLSSIEAVLAYLDNRDKA